MEEPVLIQTDTLKKRTQKSAKAHMVDICMFLFCYYIFRQNHANVPIVDTRQLFTRA